MTDLKPLYIDGKRDSRRRYVTPTGEIISRREQIRRTEGNTPEQKAVRRYEEGKSKAGVTVRRYQRKEKQRKEGIKKATVELWGNEDREIYQKTMPTGGERGYYQLQGTYQFYNPTYRSYDVATGYSTADDAMRPYMSPNYLILRRQAVLNAAAQLEGYEWKYVGVVEENWILW
ncbi:MAG: hypothetical protein PHC95_15505 [Parabacteroides sp.]|nr:hypothetical protein [Parabacteroides sp.]